MANWNHCFICLSVSLHEGTLDPFPLKQILGDITVGTAIFLIHVRHLRRTQNKPLRTGSLTHSPKASLTLGHTPCMSIATQDFTNHVGKCLPNISTI